MTPQAQQQQPRRRHRRRHPRHRRPGQQESGTAAPQQRQETRQTHGKATLRIIPLGGQEEVGRNMTVFEYGQDILILDMGVQFPEEDMPGIDYIIPNISYLKGKERRIRAVIFSHGHMDHIGASSILLERLGYPLVIGRPLTLALVKHRVEDYKKGAAARLKTITIKDVHQTMRLGAFNVGFFPVDHSIMDAVGVVLRTPAGTVVHPGDWTYEKQPIGRAVVDYKALARLPKPTILMLESLGATSKKERVSEQTMIENLHSILRDAKGRVIIGTFASQIERIRHLLEYAQKLGKKVALDGYSMKMNVRVAQELGYISIRKDLLIRPDQISNFPEGRILVLCTGAQGEGNAVLSRIVNGTHKHIRIKQGDTIVFSSSVIPGNERTIQRLKDNLYRMTDNVIHSDIMDVHTSGHSNAEDLRMVLKQVQPTYFLPVYANHYFLKEAKKLAERDGFPKDNIFVLDNGNVIEFGAGKPRILKEKVPTDYVFVDGLGVGDVSNVVLRDRQQMAGDGMLVVIATIERKTGKVIGNPDVISRGFVYMKESRQLISQVQRKVKTIMGNRDTRTSPQESFLRDKIRDELGIFLFQKTERRPMILPVIIEV